MPINSYRIIYKIINNSFLHYISRSQADETARGLPLNGVAVKITPPLFQIGLSNIDADRERNIQLIKELSWIDVAIVYSDGTRAILAVEKASLGERALAMLDSAAKEPTRQPAEMPRVPLDAALKYATLSPAQLNEDPSSCVAVAVSKM